MNFRIIVNVNSNETDLVNEKLNSITKLFNLNETLCFKFNKEQQFSDFRDKVNSIDQSLIARREDEADLFVDFAKITSEFNLKAYDPNLKISSGKETTKNLLK